ncbi:MAG: hypothetical protein ACREKS_11495 [Candidatus Rokuibacteriota bacterium]
MTAPAAAPAATARHQGGEGPDSRRTRPLRIAFLARHVGYLRNFDSVLALFAERGYDVHVILHIDEASAQGEKVLVDELRSAYPAIRFGLAPALERDVWWVLTKAIRSSIDYLRYVDPRYDRAPVLRTRSEKRIPNLLLALRGHFAKHPRLGARLFAWLKTLERGIPVNPAIEHFLAGLRADVALFTPLIDLGSQQLDYLIAAKALGLRTVLCVMSWDHLSSKSVIRVLPDMVTVWNETQKREAIELHGVPEQRIVVTGAQCFDSWFGRSPFTSRSEFCHRVGLDPDRPFILYVCSSLMRGSAPESDFLPRWIERVRDHLDPSLRDAGILVRPHPKRAAEWTRVDLGRFSNVVVWPQAGAFPVASQARRDFFDSMSHSAAVVGINTSALIEAAIVGRPVHSILLPEFRDNQEGTLHFHYLLTDGGGLLHVATSFPEHLDQLAEALANGQRARLRNERFVEAFVRPYGLGVPATPVFCDAVERLSAAPAAPPKPPLRLHGLLRCLLFISAVGARAALRRARRTATTVALLQREVETQGLPRGLVSFSGRGARAAFKLDWALGLRAARRIGRTLGATVRRMAAR